MARPQSASSASEKGNDQYANYDLNGDQAAADEGHGSLQKSPPSRSGGAGGGGSSNIDIFLRVRPVQHPSPRLLVDQTENRVEFNIPRDASAGYVNNQREHYDFRFNGVIGPEAKQDEVFERVARNVVMGSIEGYNGTIFAYGQTGSGKTFTITGGPMHYADRGIIPRSISTIFSEMSRRADSQFTVHVSYLEIYNETCFDLLDPDREIKAMEDLPQVHIMEDEEGRVSFRNLSIHRANNEEEALNLLFLGDTNRTISETPMNQASSRSHCIFTIYVEARKNGEALVRRSKLNLVDLAGSERASKTGIDGTTLREAKYINLSLHYLEQVIIALQERSMGLHRPHIPYRNSRMTAVLRDSLGGNCRTVMVATINSEMAQLDESISTCRFAMRVALVRNVVAINEETDPYLVIRQLKAENRSLREELRMLKGETEERGPLTPDEMQRLQEQLEAYVADTSPDATLSFNGSMMFIRALFDIVKQLMRKGVVLGSDGMLKIGAVAAGAGAAGGMKGGSGEAGTDAGNKDEKIKRLTLQLAQRDNEINILVGMLKRRDAAVAAGAGANANSPLGAALAAAGAGGTGTTTSVPAKQLAWQAPASGNPSTVQGGGANSNGVPRPPPPAWDASGRLANVSPSSSVATSVFAPVSQSGFQQQQHQPGGTASPLRSSVDNDLTGASRGAGAPAGPGPGSAAEDGLMNMVPLKDRAVAFDVFRRSYRQAEVHEENKEMLRVKYEKAKSLGAAVNESKTRIEELKALIKQRQVQRSVANISGEPASEPSAEEDAEEQRCKMLIEKEKAKYKDMFQSLRDVKAEIEHLQKLIQQSRERLVRDFEQWYELMSRHGMLTAGAGQDPNLNDLLTAATTNSNRSSTVVGPSAIPSSPPPRPPSRSSMSASGSHQASGTSSQSRLQGGGSSSILASQQGPGLTTAGPQGGRSPSANGSLELGQSRSGSLSAAAPPQQPWQAWGDTAGSSPAQQSPVNPGSAGHAADSSYAELRRTVNPDDLKYFDTAYQQAKPRLTGNPHADPEIIKFYLAKQKLLINLQGGVT